MPTKGKEKNASTSAEKKTKERVHSRAGRAPPPLRSPPSPYLLGALSLRRCTPPSWCAKTLTPHTWPSPPTDIVPTGFLAASASGLPRHSSIASSSAVDMPGTSQGDGAWTGARRWRTTNKLACLSGRSDGGEFPSPHGPTVAGSSARRGSSSLSSTGCA